MAIRGTPGLLTASSRLRFAALSVLVSACAGGATATPPKVATIDQIDAVIGSARCSKDDACRTVAVGAKACGGPSSYRAWSTESTDAAALQALVAKHREELMREIGRSGEYSDCAVVVDPGAFCQRSTGAVIGRCQLRPQGTQGGSALTR